VVWGEDRGAALRRMSQCLAKVELLGLANNVAFLKAAVEHPAFRAGDVHTALLVEQREPLLRSAQAGFRSLLLLALVGRLCSRAQQAQKADGYDAFSPWREARSFRVNAPACDKVALRVGEQDLSAELTFEREGFRVLLLGQTSQVRAERLIGTELSLLVDGQRLVGSYVAGAQAGQVFVGFEGASSEVHFGTLHSADEDASATLGAVRSPLPGRILSVFTEIGASVKRGDALVSLEAMKMEHTLHASVDGVVTELNVQPRDQVAEGSTLLVLQAALARGDARVDAAREPGRDRPSGGHEAGAGPKE
jgi:3-methylcrotonyl-CoA carboxylase alpha subunit